MKKVLLFIVCAVMSLSASAQYGEFYYGAKLGVNVANMAKTDEGSPVVRLNVGLTTDYRFSYRFALGAELFYSGTGTSGWEAMVVDKKPITDVVHYNLNYINIPIVAKVYLFEGLNVEAGAQVGFMVSAARNYRGSKSDLDQSALNIVEFSVPLGLMYDFDNGLTVGARMQVGVTEVFENDKNNILSLAVGYKF
ncbi:MAG: porin family protein [Rikenellaceae bacterium]